jgi:hypothetical protein
MVGVQCFFLVWGESFVVAIHSSATTISLAFLYLSFAIFVACLTAIVIVIVVVIERLVWGWASAIPRGLCRDCSDSCSGRFLSAACDCGRC